MNTFLERTVALSNAITSDGRAALAHVLVVVGGKQDFAGRETELLSLLREAIELTREDIMGVLDAIDDTHCLGCGEVHGVCVCWYCPKCGAADCTCSGSAPPKREDS